MTKNEQGDFVWWVKGALAAAAFMAPLLVSWLYEHAADLRRGVERIEERVEYQEGIIRALSEALARFDQRSIGIQENLERMLTTPAARPDPFTGTQGRALEGRIADLERCCRNRGDK